MLFISAEQVNEVLPYDQAMRAIERALDTHLDPEDDSPRIFSPAPGGEFLVMPAQGAEYSGLKALSIAPENPAKGLEKIQGLYILFDSDNLSPVAVLDGVSLTAIRTPAAALLAVEKLAKISPTPFPTEPNVLIFGTGIQARAHIEATLTVFPNAQFSVVGRTFAKAETFASSLAPLQVRGVEYADQLVRDADLIICASSTELPLFDGTLVADHAIVVAIGTHGRERREVDAALALRSDVVVEGRASAKRENGNLVEYFETHAEGPGNLRDLVKGQVERHPGRPALYTGVGMAWEDLVCATAAYERVSGLRP